MSVNTNDVSLQYAKEQSIGVLPGSPEWVTVEPNNINTFGATITTVARQPISKNRQRRKGTTTDLDSAVEFDADLIGHHVHDFFAAFLFAVPNGPNVWGEYETDDVTDVTATGYTVTANGDVPDDTIVYARGFAEAANNGLKVTAGTSTATEVKTTGLVVEATPPAGARLEVGGVQGASGDIQIDASGDIISAAALDFTTLDLTVGQSVWVGGVADATRFGTIASPSNNRGWARITKIETLKLTIDNTSQAFSVDSGAAKTIHLYFGLFLRNVSIDDADYLQTSFQFEAGYPNLGGVGNPEYEYAKGNLCDSMQLNLPLTDKATVTFGFVGTDTPAPVIAGSRASGAATPLDPVETTAFNTSADIARLRVAKLDETGIATFFKTLSLTFNNNVSPVKCLGTLGALDMNVGNFEVDIEAQTLFDNKEIPTAIRDNTTVAIQFSLRNEDRALLFDLPALTLQGGDKEFPVNEKVLINIPSQAHEDPTLGISSSISLFPFAPSA